MSMPLETLSSVASIFNGKTPAKADQRIEGHPVLKIKDVSEDGFFKGSFQSFVDSNFVKKFSDKTIITGDTLILNAAHNADYVGSKIYRAENDVEGALATGEWTLVRSNKSVLDSQYLYYWLLSGQTRHHIRQIVKGIHLYPKDVSRLKIPLPPLEEQKRIAAILDKADAIRRKRKEAIQLTEELLRSTFLDMFGDPVGRNKQWKRHNLSDFVSVVSGQVDPQTEPYIDMPHIGGDNIESNTGFIHKVQTPRELKLISGKYLFEPTDILYSKIRPYLNKVSIPGFVGVCSADIYPLRIDESIVDREYLVYLLRSSEFLSYAEKHSARTNIPKINRPALLKFTSKLPPLELQKKFSQIYRNVFDTKKNLNSSIKESDNLFNSLLQKAFRGEL